MSPPRRSGRELLVAIDVGGTRTRARVGLLVDGRVLPHSKFPGLREQRVDSKDALGRYIRRLLADVRGSGTLSRCAVDFAGPVIARREVEITNWPGVPKIDLSDLYTWGLPEGRTLMLNDIEAAAFAIMALEARGEVPSARCVRLFDSVDSGEPGGPRAHKIVLVPGTGLGTAGLVGWRAPSSGDLVGPVASEIQHSGVVPIDDTHSWLIRWSARTRRVVGWPSWEDFVSGRGLVTLYHGLCAKHGRRRRARWDADADAAATIAGHAVTGSDPVCEEALDIYYRCLGRLAQIMALAYLPFGGIFIGGNSTIRNAAFIARSRFMDELHANRRRLGLLKRFPVYLLLEELNLSGSLWACREEGLTSGGTPAT